jgi:hypothetical protein
MHDELMPRPSLSDSYVRRRAAEIVWPEVRSLYGLDESEAPGWLGHLAAVASLSDGYEIARHLERRGLSADAGLVEVLDGCWVRQAIEELTRQWVRCLNIQPAFKVGDVVFVRSRRPDEAAVVAEVRSDLAEYGVRWPDMSANVMGIVKFEDCSPALVAAAS